MGRKDISLKSYLRDTARYADLWNGGVFQGRQIVRAEELQEVTPVRSGKGRSGAVEKIGDIVMKQTYSGQRFAILSLENQDEVDYGIPVRIMLQEALEYDRQLRDIRSRNEKKNEEYRECRKSWEENGGGIPEKVYKDAGEFLYKIKKEDRLFPMATLVVYWGEEMWQGPKSLYEMMDFGDMTGEVGSELKSLIPEYPLHFLDLSSFGHLEYFKTELRPLLELYAKRNSKETLKECLEVNEAYWDMNNESWHVLSQLTGSKSLEKLARRKSRRNEEGEKMFRPLDDMISNAKAEGLAEGKTKGKAESIVDLLEEYGTVQDKLKKEIFKQRDLQILKEWLKLAVRVKNADEFARQMYQ